MQVLIITATWVSFLGAFAKLPKANISFVMSVRPHGTTQLPQEGFSWNLILEGFFEKSVEKIEVPLKPDKNKGHFIWKPIYIFIISLSFHLRMRNVSDKSCSEYQNTNFVFSNLFFLNRAFYEKMWKNIQERGRPDITIAHVHCMLDTQGYSLSVALVRKRTIPTERQPPVGEVSANFCG